MKMVSLCSSMALLCFTLSAYAVVPAGAVGQVRQGAVNANVGAPQAAMESQQQAQQQMQTNKMMQKKQKKMHDMHDAKAMHNAQDKDLAIPQIEQ